MIILKNNLIYIHIPKTAGRFIGMNLQKLGKADSWCPYSIHDGVNEIMEEHSNYKTIATVRNPWKWYVSLWAFKNQRKMRFGKRRINKKRIRIAPEPDFESFLMRLYNEEYISNYNEEAFLIGRLKVNFQKMIDGEGAYTQIIKNQCYKNGKDAIDTYLKLEDFHTKFQETFKLTDEEMEKVDLNVKTGQSKHEWYGDYYSDELQALVAEKEKFIIDKFNYKF